MKKQPRKDRKERLAAALRENLKKRKAQGKARSVESEAEKRVPRTKPC